MLLNAMKEKTLTELFEKALKKNEKLVESFLCNPFKFPIEDEIFLREAKKKAKYLLDYGLQFIGALKIAVSRKYKGIELDVNYLNKFSENILLFYEKSDNKYVEGWDRNEYLKEIRERYHTLKPYFKVKEFIGIDLMDSASFLGLDVNWFRATCALQLQEVAVTLMAERKNIKLDKANVEKILQKKIEERELSFNEKYDAFSKQVKSFNVAMPKLTIDLRNMRTEVLHKGYNPKTEETEAIVSFTIELLKTLEDID
jgi:hypothetical protein